MDTVTTNLGPSAPAWDRTCALPGAGDLDLAADVVRTLDRIPGLDAEELARLLGTGDWRMAEVTAALMGAGILGEAT